MKEEYRVTEANERDQITGIKIPFFVIEQKFTYLSDCNWFERWLLEAPKENVCWTPLHGFGDIDLHQGMRRFTTREKAEECIKNLMEE